MDRFEQVSGNYYTTYPLRISDDLKERLKAAAVKHKRSINKEIEFALEQYLSELEK